MKNPTWKTRLGAPAIILAAVLAISSDGVAWADAGFDAQLLDIETRWAEANYKETGKAQKQAFETLMTDARAFATAHPDRAEASIWRGIVASTYAGVKGPFGAMALAEEAKTALETAESINPDALEGSVYSSLGALYYKVPGGMIGFGDDDKARDYLQKAVAVNPKGIDSNYFYGEFLYEQDEYQAARDALLKAQQAPARPDRPLADQGRQVEIDALLAKVNKKLGLKG